MSRLHFADGLFGQLRQAAGGHWQAYVEHPFVRQLATGSLPEPAFRRYLIQDYLFLIQFARAYALLACKLRTLADIRAAARSLSAIVAELPLHVNYCARWGLSESDLSNTPEAAETFAYTRYVLDIGQSGDALDLLVALAPCVVGYAEIGLRLLEDPATVMAGNPYASWMRNYGDPQYQDGVQNSLNLLNQVGQQRGADSRFSGLSSIFTTATQLETAFWQMGLNVSTTREVSR